jgi:hypothetical protein
MTKKLLLQLIKEGKMDLPFKRKKKSSVIRLTPMSDKELKSLLQIANR